MRYYNSTSDSRENVALPPPTDNRVSVLEIPLLCCCCVAMRIKRDFPRRIHLQHRVEDEEQCRSLIKELQGQIQQAFTTDIQDGDVLEERYIRRVLQLRKVTITKLL